LQADNKAQLKENQMLNEEINRLAVDIIEMKANHKEKSKGFFKR